MAKHPPSASRRAASGSPVQSVPCPRCQRPVRLGGAELPAWAPFCSERCRLLDLGAWDDGAYRIGRSLTYDDLEEAEVDERDFGGGV